MSLLRSCRGAALVASCVAAAACSDGTGPTESLVTVDTLFADMTEAVSFSSAALGGGDVTLVGGSVPSTDACAYNASTQRFVCPAVTEDGFTVSRYFQLFDASGQAQAAFNQATTASIKVVSDISGTQSSTEDGVPMSITLEGHNEMTLSGLLTNTRTLNGSGSTNMDMSFTIQGESISTSFRAVETITDLVLPERNSANRYPRSGSMTIELSTPEGDFDTRITITFNGTSTATVVLTSSGFTQTCKVNMANPEAVPSCT